MKIALKRVVIAVVATAAGAASAAGSSLCQALATQAARIPAADWRASTHDPMDRLWGALPVDGAPRPPSPVEERLLGDPAVREQLGVGPDERLLLDPLPGTSIYRIDAFQGTAVCQSMVFVDAAPGKPLRFLPAPFDVEQPCTTQRGRFGHVLGTPVFIVGGWVSMESLARTYQVSAWRAREKTWTPACALSLTFNTRWKLSGRYCGPDASLCRAAAQRARSIVAAYDAEAPLDPLRFAQGREPPQALKDLLPAESTAEPALPSELPTFGAKTAGTRDPFLTSFSNAKETVRLALWLDDRWWLGVVGVAGVGWRSSATSLLAIYAVSDAGLTPAAGFQVEQQVAGPARARWR